MTTLAVKNRNDKQTGLVPIGTDALKVGHLCSNEISVQGE